MKNNFIVDCDGVTGFQVKNTTTKKMWWFFYHCKTSNVTSPLRLFCFKSDQLAANDSYLTITLFLFGFLASV